jgi:hypothetical protein
MTGRELYHLLWVSGTRGPKLFEAERLLRDRPDCTAEELRKTLEEPFCQSDLTRQKADFLLSGGHIRQLLGQPPKMDYQEQDPMQVVTGPADQARAAQLRREHAFAPGDLPVGVAGRPLTPQEKVEAERLEREKDLARKEGLPPAEPAGPPTIPGKDLKEMQRDLDRRQPPPPGGKKGG